jgi:hypothetical protein
VAIRLRDDGNSDHVIAVALEIGDEQVPTVLHIADSKLTNLLALDLAHSLRTDRNGRPHATHTYESKNQRGSS